MNLSASTTELLLGNLERMNLSAIAEPLLNYLMLLIKWNKAYNLTAIRDPDQMVIRHLLDSLAINPWVLGQSLLDVGSGAGLPGVPLAIANPGLKVVLLDSNGKKTRFLEEVRRQLKIKNMEVIQSRVENYQPPFDFDTVTSRAFSELAQMLKWTNHLISNNGIWLAMKGRYPEAELTSIQYPYQIEPYTVPGLDEERCCIIIQNATKE